ncbi:MAG: Fic family protein [Owenweeksia sp.]|nr:Fic family protein [Owenweeksia sp.]
MGDYDRNNAEPMPDHISARPEDLESLMEALFETNELLQRTGFPALLSATIISFSFVFVHPLVDGNGRLHRYLIHHILSRKGFTPQGMGVPGFFRYSQPYQ